MFIKISGKPRVTMVNGEKMHIWRIPVELKHFFMVWAEKCPSCSTTQLHGHINQSIGPSTPINTASTHIWAEGVGVCFTVRAMTASYADSYCISHSNCHFSKSPLLVEFPSVSGIATKTKLRSKMVQNSSA